MQVLGQGHKGIVIAEDEATVSKYYKNKKEWQEEKTALEFLAIMQRQGFSLGCTIPKLYTAKKGEWIVEGNVYNFSSTMERVHGVSLSSKLEDDTLQQIGVHLGTILFTMHSTTSPYVNEWKASARSEDTLFQHIFNDKVSKILKHTESSTDQEFSKWVEEAVAYLRKKQSSLDANVTLSHQDLNLPNILVNSNQVAGLVDWDSFGLTNASLAMYQLAIKPRLWRHVKEQYRKLGGIIEEDVMYAAATIHLAWAPIICKELGLELAEDEGREMLSEMHASFVNCAT